MENLMCLTQNVDDMSGMEHWAHEYVSRPSSRPAEKFQAIVTLAQAHDQYKKLSPPPTNESPVSNSRANFQFLEERSDSHDDDFNLPESNFDVSMFLNGHGEDRFLPDITSSGAAAAHNHGLGLVSPSNDDMASSYVQTASMGWNADCASVLSSSLTDHMTSSSRAGSATEQNGELESPAGLRGDAESLQMPSADSMFWNGLLGTNPGPRSSDASPAAEGRSSQRRPEAENSLESYSEWLDRNWRSEEEKFFREVDKIATGVQGELNQGRSKKLMTRSGVDAVIQTIRKVGQNVKPLTDILDLVRDILISNSLGVLDAAFSSRPQLRDYIVQVYESASNAVKNLNLMSVNTDHTVARLSSAYKILEKDIVAHAFQKYVNAVTGQLQKFLHEQKPSSVCLLYRTLTACRFGPDSLLESAYMDGSFGHHADRCR